MIAPSTVPSRLGGRALPIPLREWRATTLSTNVAIFAEAMHQQCAFVLNRLAYMLMMDIPQDGGMAELDDRVHVVSTHVSKSVTLPVFHLAHPRGGLELVMRNNFHGWRVSVVSSRLVKDNFYDLFDRTLKIDAIFCEGFDPAWVFGSYEQNQQQFTVELGDDYVLHTFLWLLLKSRES